MRRILNDMTDVLLIFTLQYLDVRERCLFAGTSKRCYVFTLESIKLLQGATLTAANGEQVVQIIGHLCKRLQRLTMSFPFCSNILSALRLLFRNNTNLTLVARDISTDICPMLREFNVQIEELRVTCMFGSPENFENQLILPNMKNLKRLACTKPSQAFTCVSLEALLVRKVSQAEIYNLSKNCLTLKSLKVFEQKENLHVKELVQLEELIIMYNNNDSNFCVSGLEKLVNLKTLHLQNVGSSINFFSSSCCGVSHLRKVSYLHLNLSTTQQLSDILCGCRNLKELGVRYSGEKTMLQLMTGLMKLGVKAAKLRCWKIETIRKQYYPGIRIRAKLVAPALRRFVWNDVVILQLDGLYHQLWRPLSPWHYNGGCWTFKP